MATDPIRGVREQTHETPLDLEIRSVAQRLAILPPSPDAPYLTVSLDWRPDGSNPGRAASDDFKRSERRSADTGPGASQRPSRQAFEREAAAILEAWGPRGDAFDSLSSDIARVGEYLDNDLDPAAQGVFIVACAAQEVFETVALGLPLETRIGVGPVPAISPLVQVDEDNPVYAVLVADQHEATISVVAQARLDASVTVLSTDYPRKQQQGGWSQRRFQARADERVAAFARGVAEETQRALEETAAEMLIIAGDEVITSALDEAFHQTVKERIIGTVRLDAKASEADIVESTREMVEQVERTQEMAAVQAVLDGIGAGTYGSGGIDDVLTALQAGQVETLVVADDFSANGWADYGLPLYGSGFVPSQHPAGGDVADLQPVDLREEMIRLALATGARVEIVSSAPEVAAADLEEIPDSGLDTPRSESVGLLDDLGGIGAILRFTLDSADEKLPDEAT
jgi:hypothetical protein